MQEQLYNMLLQKDELTWQSLLYELVRTEQMDPWDIDISLLTKRYIETIRKLKEANFFISGKVLLASAILLKMKSTKLVTEDIANFDTYLNPPEETYDEIQDLIENHEEIEERPLLTIKTPQPRKRKVTLNDLMGALQKALNINQRRVIRKVEAQKVNVEIPKIKIDITKLIKDMYTKIINFFNFKKEKLTFDKLVMSDRREDKILTLIPLLHLDHQQKIYLNQAQPFGEIEITILGES